MVEEFPASSLLGDLSLSGLLRLSKDSVDFVRLWVLYAETS